MNAFRFLLPVWGLFALQIAAGQQMAAEIANDLHRLALDPEQTYFVRDLQLSRGDLKIYLGEGVLSLATPVNGQRMAAVFTSREVEAGDAEIIALPPQQSERASLASFTKSPNLDEHLTAAILLFSDDTARDLLQQIQSGRVRRADALLPGLASQFTPLLGQVAGSIEIRLVQALLDNHPPENGFFYALLNGRTLGNFDVLYEPNDFEPITIGRPATTPNAARAFELWTSFRPRRSPPFRPPEPRISDYRITADIAPDLSMSVVAAFTATADQADTHVLSFGISERLRVTSAKVDDKPVEVFQKASARVAEVKRTGSFLLVSNVPWTAGSRHHVELAYNGGVITQTRNRLYFVDERNTWYPFNSPTLANFDLTFRCPKSLRIVSTGEPVSEDVQEDTRIMHRRTRVPEALAGFNLGNYESRTSEHGAYHIECDANRSIFEGLGDIPKQTEQVLDFYTQRWGKLPIQNLTVSPIPGYFGQGFPGLIFLSTVSYMREEDRPVPLRTARMRTFFDNLLLSHEIAHQWWGNIVTPADYRSGWLMEAMANYAALDYIRSTSGSAARDAVLQEYKQDLLTPANGATLESTAPIDFGIRLLEFASRSAWHAIIYEKGTWILRMLEQRLGEERFHDFQNDTLKEFSSRPITNDEFRRLASRYVPPGEPDKDLSLFFETWVYNTGIPALALNRHSRTITISVDKVADDFTADVPLSCRAGEVRKADWVRLSTGSQTLSIPSWADDCSLPEPDSFLYAGSPKK